jgi:hypothetical protein
LPETKSTSDSQALRTESIIDREGDAVELWQVEMTDRLQAKRANQHQIEAVSCDAAE